MGRANEALLTLSSPEFSKEPSDPVKGEMMSSPREAPHLNPQRWASALDQTRPHLPPSGLLSLKPHYARDFKDLCRYGTIF